MKLLSLLLILSILLSCNNSTETKTETSKDTTAIEPTPATVENSVRTTDSPEGSADYNYEPAVSTITGTLGSESFDGPNQTETVTILSLDKGINVIAPKTADGPESKYNVTKIQLIPADGVDLKPYTGKKVTLKGTFFEPHTGHHFTQVMMDVSKVE